MPKKVGEQIGVHQPIRITNNNLSFTFLIGKKKWNSNDNDHRTDTAQESDRVLSM